MTGITLQLHKGTRAKHRAGPKEAVELIKKINY
jgi:hypothetical protein